jgi:hypothetical protein
VIRPFRDGSQSDPRLTDSCPFRYGVAGMEASEHGARNGQKGRLFFVLTACGLASSLGLGALWGKARTLRDWEQIRSYSKHLDWRRRRRRVALPVASQAERTSNAALQHHRLVISFLHAAASVNFYLAL